MSPRKILITSGPTREPIDGVRFLTNFSTGRTGARLAEVFGRAGYAVTYLQGPGAAAPQGGAARIVGFETFADLDTALRALLAEGEYAAILHLAAVGDYSVDSVQVGGERFAPHVLRKLDSSEPVSIHLKRNFKIVERVRGYSPRPLRLVAFKLTRDASPAERLAAVARLDRAAAPDWIVHNDLSEIVDPRDHAFTLYSGTQPTGAFASVDELAARLITLLEKS
jgi:phosphopantothenoylcysteine decarboxylase/phosphopantothenate--cysteine ligase